MGKVRYTKEDKTKAEHLAGIIPIGGKRLDFNMPWHDCLMPIGPDYLAIESAVYECAMAGCDTIWITGNKGMTPLVRSRLGDFVLDPVSFNGRLRFARKRSIPIFYVPILTKDLGRRDCLGWSILYGADSAFRVSGFISKWISAKRFYCAFPHGLLPSDFIREQRKDLKKDLNTVFSYNGKTIKDGLPISFTFGANEYKACRDIIKKRNIDEWSDLAAKKAPDFTLSEVFAPLDLTACRVVDLPLYYDVSSWNKYVIYMSSEMAANAKKNKVVFTKEKRKLFPSEREIRSHEQYGESTDV